MLRVLDMQRREEVAIWEARVWRPATLCTQGRARHVRYVQASASDVAVPLTSPWPRVSYTERKSADELYATAGWAREQRSNATVIRPH